MNHPRLAHDEASFLDQVRRDSGRRIAQSLRRAGGDVAHGVDLAPVVRKHPLRLMASALALGFIGAILARHHFRRSAERSALAKRHGGTPTPASAGARPAGGMASGLMDLLLRDVVIPFVADKAAGVMQRIASPPPERGPETASQRSERA